MNDARKSTDLNSPSFRFLAGISAQAAGAREDNARPGNVDFAELQYLISRHRVSSEVLERIAKSDVPIGPRSREELLAGAKKATIHAMTLATETCRLSTALSAAGVRHLILKGTALSQRLYGHAAARSSKDIDILVDPQMFSAAGSVIVNYQYQFKSGYSPQAISFYPKHATPKDATYHNGSTGIEIELHHRLFTIPSLLPLDFERLWGNRGSVKLGNVDLPVLATGDEFIYMCVHGAIHNWFRLKWLQDVARLLVITTTEQFNEISNNADRLGVRQLVVSAIALAEEIFELDRSPAALRLSVSDNVARDIIRHSRLALAKPENAWQSLTQIVSATWLLVKFRPECSYKRAVLAKFIISPIDVEMLQLPARSSGLYYIVRPFLLIKRRSLRLFQNKFRHLKS